MRGLSNSENSSTRQYYFTIARGAFVRRVEEGTKGATSRTLKKGKNEGKVVHEISYNNIEGQITDIYLDTAPWGQNWKISLDISSGEDGIQEFAIISIPYDNSYAQMILKRLPNIDLDQDVSLRTGAGKDKETGKDFSYLTAYQNGTKIQPAFTKEEPNGMPEMKVVHLNGQKHYDKVDILKFLEKVVADKFNRIDEPQETDDVPF